MEPGFYRCKACRRCWSRMEPKWGGNPRPPKVCPHCQAGPEQQETDQTREDAYMRDVYTPIAGVVLGLIGEVKSGGSKPAPTSTPASPPAATPVPPPPQTTTPAHVLVHAPWTADQVASLQGFQSSQWHPFTGARQPDNNATETVLIATPAGWTEREGGPIVQTWAHDFMVNWSWKQTRETT